MLTSIIQDSITDLLDNTSLTMSEIIELLKGRFSSKLTEDEIIDIIMNMEIG